MPSIHCCSVMLPDTREVDGVKEHGADLHAGDSAEGCKVAHSGLCTVVVHGVEHLVVAFQIIGDAQHRLDGTALGKQLAGLVAVQVSHELLGGIQMLGTGPGSMPARTRCSCTDRRRP